MDLGIAGRKAIVCASAEGPGRRLRAGPGGGRMRGRDERPRRRGRWRPRPPKSPQRPAPRSCSVAGDSAPRPARAPDRRLSGADILVNNNGGPPLERFPPDSPATEMMAGLDANMIAPIELIQG